AIGFTERVGSKNQCIARVKGHRGGAKTVLQPTGPAKAGRYDRHDQVRLKPDTTADAAKVRRQCPEVHVHLRASRLPRAPASRETLWSKRTARAPRERPSRCA